MSPPLQSPQEFPRWRVCVHSCSVPALPGVSQGSAACDAVNEEDPERDRATQVRSRGGNCIYAPKEEEEEEEEKEGLGLGFRV